MGFTILRKNMIIEAAEVNNNFLHAAQGDYLPRDGASLTASTNDYDLGNSTWRYRNIYARTIDGQIGIMRRIASYNIQTSGVTSVEFTGLNFHLYDIIQITYYGLVPNLATSTSLDLLLNNDSTSSYIILSNFYGYVFGSGSPALKSTSRTQTTGFPLGFRFNNYPTAPTYQLYSRVTIKNKEGYKKYISSEMGNGKIDGGSRYEKHFGEWNNTNTITSLKISFTAFPSGTATFASNTMIDIWAS